MIEGMKANSRPDPYNILIPLMCCAPFLLPICQKDGARMAWEPQSGEMVWPQDESNLSHLSDHLEESYQPNIGL